MQSLINAAFWQTTGYCELPLQRMRVRLLTSGRFQYWLCMLIRSRASLTLQDMAVPQRQDPPNSQLGNESQRRLAGHLRHSLHRRRLRKVHSRRGKLEPYS